MLGIASIFTYNLKKGFDNLKAANAENHSLTDFDMIAKRAAALKYVKEEDIESLIEFRNSLG